MTDQWSHIEFELMDSEAESIEYEYQKNESDPKT